MVGKRGISIQWVKRKYFPALRGQSVGYDSFSSTPTNWRRFYYFGCSFFRMRRTSMNVNDVVTEIKQPKITSTMKSIYAVRFSSTI